MIAKKLCKWLIKSFYIVIFTFFEITPKKITENFYEKQVPSNISSAAAAYNEMDVGISINIHKFSFFIFSRKKKNCNI